MLRPLGSGERLVACHYAEQIAAGAMPPTTDLVGGPSTSPPPNQAARTPGAAVPAHEGGPST